MLLLRLHLLPEPHLADFRHATEEEILVGFPHVVCHDAEFGSPKWALMIHWLRAHVGEHDQAWSWLVSSQLRFRSKSDAAQFSLVWG